MPGQPVPDSDQYPVAMVHSRVATSAGAILHAVMAAPNRFLSDAEWPGDTAVRIMKTSECE